MKAHRTDGVALTFAVVFLLFCSWWLLAQLFDLTLPRVGWFVASGLIVFGLLGLLAAVRAGRTERGGDEPVAGVSPTSPVAEPAGPPDEAVPAESWPEPVEPGDPDRR